MSVFALPSKTVKAPLHEQNSAPPEPIMAQPKSAAPVVQPASRAIAAETKQRLEAALDELVVCRKLMEAALVGDETSARSDQDR